MGEEKPTFCLAVLPDYSVIYPSLAEHPNPETEDVPTEIMHQYLNSLVGLKIIGATVGGSDTLVIEVE